VGSRIRELQAALAGQQNMAASAAAGTLVPAAGKLAESKNVSASYASAGGSQGGVVAGSVTAPPRPQPAPSQFANPSHLTHPSRHIASSPLAQPSPQNNSLVGASKAGIEPKMEEWEKRVHERENARPDPSRHTEEERALARELKEKRKWLEEKQTMTRTATGDIPTRTGGVSFSTSYPSAMPEFSTSFSHAPPLSARAASPPPPPPAAYSANAPYMGNDYGNGRAVLPPPVVSSRQPQVWSNVLCV